MEGIVGQSVVDGDRLVIQIQAESIANLLVISVQLINIPIGIMIILQVLHIGGRSSLFLIFLRQGKQLAVTSLCDFISLFIL
jgi:hypothetical protein